MPADRRVRKEQSSTAGAGRQRLCPLLKLVGAVTLLLLVVIALIIVRRASFRGNSNDQSPQVNKSLPIETPSMTSAQIAALAGGQQVTWNEQGVSWTLPPGWTKTSATNETAQYGSSDGSSLVVNISAMESDFPGEISLRGFHQAAKVREKNGQLEEVKWLELDGLPGVAFRESKPQIVSHVRRLQWTAVRNYQGQTQRVSLTLLSNDASFEKHQDALYAILYSTKLAH